MGTMEDTAVKGRAKRVRADGRVRGIRKAGAEGLLGRDCVAGGAEDVGCHNRCEDVA